MRRGCRSESPRLLATDTLKHLEKALKAAEDGLNDLRPRGMASSFTCGRKSCLLYYSQTTQVLSMRSINRILFTGDPILEAIA